MIYQKIQTILPFLSLISILVFVHESGHYIAAKIRGVKVLEFAIGFGQTLCSFKNKSGTIFMLKLIPFGGYVKMLGDENVSSFQKQEISNDKENINSKTPLEKIFIGIAGPLANFTLAFLIIFLMYFVQKKNVYLPVIQEVVKESIAHKNDLKIGDKILEIDNKKINFSKDILKFLTINIKKEFEIKIERKKKIFTKKILLEKNYQVLGIIFDQIPIKLNISQKFLHSISDVYFYIKSNFIGIKQLVMKQRNLSGLGGPIKIASMSKDASDQGIWNFMNFLSMISIGLGFMNLLPIPMLDGGGILINLIEIIIGNSISKFAYKLLYYIGILILGFLTIFVFLNDIKSLFY